MEKQDSFDEAEKANKELLESWELLKSQEPEESVEPEKNTSEIVHHSEDSDGISVISESELYKTISENEMEKVEESVTDDEKIEDHLPLTPPATPKMEVEEKNEDTEPCFIHQGNKTLIFGAGLIVIAAIFYSHVNGLRVDLQKCDQRILKLEEENQMLKAALDRLEKIANPETLNNPDLEIIPEFVTGEPVAVKPTIEEEIRKPPATKKVWIGSETEHEVEILDRKNELPDYCFQTEEDDLFFEYNQEICGQKRQKLERKSAKESKKMKNDWDDETYDFYIQKTLNSLTDEIAEIKRKRNTESEEIDSNPEEKSKNSPKKPKKYKKNLELSEKIKNSQEKVDFPDKTTSDPAEKNSKSKKRKPKRKENWITDRDRGREEARKLQQKKEESEENWYLKRKNERELDRLQS